MNRIFSLKKYEYILFAIFLIFIFSISKIVLNKIKIDSVKTVENSIASVNKSCEEALNQWLYYRENHIKSLSRNNFIVEKTITLSKLKQDSTTLLNSNHTTDLREYIKPILESNGDLGAFIISPNRLNIFSMRNSNTGSMNLMQKQSPNLLDKVLIKGETVLVPPITSDVKLNSPYSGITDQTMFLVTPIKYENKIIAALAIRLDTHKDFSRILKIGNIGKTGETYAVNKSNKILSNTNYKTDYTNEVLSIQTWNNNLNLGIVTKIDKNEGLQEYFYYRNILISSVISIVIGLFIVIIIISKLRQKAENTLTSSNKNLKSEIEKRSKELEKTNHLLASAEEIVKLGVWEMDIETGKTIWSDIVYDIHEVSRDFDHNKVNGIEFYHPDYRPIITEAITLCITKGQPFNVVCQMITAKNNLVWVRSTGRRVSNKILGSFQDISDIKEQETKYKSVLDGTNAGIWEWNVQTGETIFNDRWAKILGYTLDELEPMNYEKWRSFIHPEDVIEFDRKFNECAEKKLDFFEFENRKQHKKGHWVWLYAKGKIFSWTEDGKPLKVYGTHQDITEKKEKELEINYQKEILGALFKLSPFGIVLNNYKTGEFIDANPNFLESVGYSKEEFSSLNFTDFVPKKHYHFMGSAKEELKSQGKYNLFEADCIKKDGTTFPIDIQGVSIKDIKGKKLVWTFIKDLTEKKNKETELNYQKNILKALYELSPIGIALNDYESGKFIDVNNKFLEPLGYTKDEFLKLSYWDITPKGYEDLETKALEQMQAKGSYDLFKKHYIAKKGVKFPVELQGTVIKDSNGKKLIWSIIRDISKEVEAEQKLKDTLSKLQGILNASKQVSIIVTDLEGNITMFNAGAEQMLGYTSKEMVGKTSPAILHVPAEMEKHSRELSEKYNEEIVGFESFVYESELGLINSKEWTYIRKDGSTLPVLLSVNAILKNNKITGYMGVAVDIRELKKVEKEIKSLLDITQDQNDRLRNFAHIISHNLRSFSSGISGILNLIELKHPDIAKNKLVEMLKSGSENLQQTVADLSEVVKVNFDEKENNPILLNNFITKTINSLKLQIQKSDIDIINNIDNDLIIKGVPDYIDSILSNIITNAIKYRSTERKSYLKIYSISNETTINIYFEDNGLGIDLEKNASKIFGMYKTFHKHEDSRGLGLFITKSQVESMGGKIEVGSQVGVGTTFKISIPK